MPRVYVWICESGEANDNVRAFFYFTTASNIALQLFLFREETMFGFMISGECITDVEFISDSYRPAFIPPDMALAKRDQATQTSSRISSTCPSRPFRSGQHSPQSGLAPPF